MHKFSKQMKKVKITSDSTTRYYLVIVDIISMHTNMIKDKIIDNMRKLLNEKFMYVSNSFPIKEILEALTMLYSCVNTCS